MHGYLSLDIICSLKLTVFLELRSRKTVRFTEQIMSKDKYSRQMETIVYIWTVTVLYGLLLCYMDCYCVIWTVTVLYGLLLCYMDCYCVIWTATVLYGLLLCYMDCYCVICTATVLYGLLQCYMDCYCDIWTATVVLWCAAKRGGMNSGKQSAEQFLEANFQKCITSVSDSVL